MRYLRIKVTPTEGEAFHPLGQRVADEPSITRERLHRIELLTDDTGALLIEHRGDVDRHREILRSSEHVLDFAISAADCWWIAYVHFEPNDLVRRIVETRHLTPVVVEMPVDICPDGAHVYTFVGDEEAFADAVVEDSAYSIEVLETGDRRPDADDRFADLTARQHEILDAAVRLGYYESPREATQGDVAAAVDATPGTVGEHLRKIESRVFSQYR